MAKNAKFWLLFIFLFLTSTIGVGTSSSAGIQVSEQNSTLVPVITTQPAITQTSTPSLEPATLTPKPTWTKVLPTETATPTPAYKYCGIALGEICFGDYYNELPGDTYVNKIIVPDTIVIHTDDASGNTPERWFGANTWYGLEGRDVSTHFSVGLDGVSQFLPMYESGVTQCRGGQYSYNLHTIQIEMSGRNYNYFITGQASPQMAASVVTITDKTIDLVIILMNYYHIPVENIMGHYQMEGSGKTDPGNLYFEQYFLPLLKSRLK